MPAAVSFASARSRTAGSGERASTCRMTRASSVISDTYTCRSFRACSRSSTSTSRVTSGLLVMSPMVRPAQRASRSSTCRVSRKRRSAGW
jgi:hypothetical protein